MAKRPADLRKAMQDVARPAAAVRSAVAGDPPVESQQQHPRPGRKGKSNVTGYFAPEVKKQLRLLAAEQDTTIQNLLAEALNDLFAKNGKPEIAPLEEKGWSGRKPASR